MLMDACFNQELYGRGHGCPSKHELCEVNGADALCHGDIHMHSSSA